MLRASYSCRDLSNNAISGTLPAEWGARNTLARLTTLSLESNLIGGEDCCETVFCLILICHAFQHTLFRLWTHVLTSPSAFFHLPHSLSSRCISNADVGTLALTCCCRDLHATLLAKSPYGKVRASSAGQLSLPRSRAVRDQDQRESNLSASPSNLCYTVSFSYMPVTCLSVDKALWSLLGLSFCWSNLSPSAANLHSFCWGVYFRDKLCESPRGGFTLRILSGTVPVNKFPKNGACSISASFSVHNLHLRDILRIYAVSYQRTMLRSETQSQVLRILTLSRIMHLTKSVLSEDIYLHALDKNGLYDAGALPSDWSSGFVSLTVLNLGYNILTGSLPATFGSNTAFQQLQVCFLKLSMTIIIMLVVWTMHLCYSFIVLVCTLQIPPYYSNGSAQYSRAVGRLFVMQGSDLPNE